MMSIPSAQADDRSSAGFIGKDDWLFYRVEFGEPSDEVASNINIDLINRFNRVLARNGITMAFVMVPIKIRIYADYLPEDVILNSFTLENYDRLVTGLRAAGVNVIDLNTPFLNNPKRKSDLPLFFV